MATAAIPKARRAEKKRVKIKIGIQGPSGSGKTWAALALAANVWPGARVCVIDTENDSSLLYADQWNFDQIPLGPPFTSARYEECIESVVRDGYDVLIMDTITHQWDGEGGILSRKAEMDARPGANSWANWEKFTPEHRAFIEAIKQSPIHIIATMRTKQDYVLEQTDKGKSKPVKVGMAPIVREGTDYEFSIVFDVQMDHKAQVSKNRTGMFDGEILDLASPKVADRLQGWLSSGIEVKGEDTKTWSAPKTAVPDGPRERQTANRSTQQQSERHGASEPQQTVFSLADDLLTCVPFEAKRMDKNGSRFIAVKMNGRVAGSAMAFCFVESLFGAVLNCPHNESTFRMDLTEYPYITDVLKIGGRVYEKGLPVQEKPKTQVPEQSAASQSAVSDPPKTNEDPVEITNDDIPF